MASRYNDDDDDDDDIKIITGSELVSVLSVPASAPLSLSEWSFTICPTPYNRK